MHRTRLGFINQLTLCLLLVSFAAAANASNRFSLSHAQGQPLDTVAIKWSFQPTTPANLYSLDMCITWSPDLIITDISGCTNNLPPGVGPLSACSLTSPNCPSGLYIFALSTFQTPFLPLPPIPDGGEIRFEILSSAQIGSILPIQIDCVSLGDGVGNPIPCDDNLIQDHGSVFIPPPGFVPNTVEFDTAAAGPGETATLNWSWTLGDPNPANGFQYCLEWDRDLAAVANLEDCGSGLNTQLFACLDLETETCDGVLVSALRFTGPIESAVFAGSLHFEIDLLTPRGMEIPVTVRCTDLAAGTTSLDCNHDFLGIDGLIIVPQLSAVTIDPADLVQVYDGTPKSVAVSTDPPGLAIEITYDGSPEPPVDAGEYAVHAFVIDGAWSGEAFATLIVERSPQSIDFATINDRYTNAPPFGLTASASSGLPVGFNVVSGPAILDGATLSLTGEPGTVLVEASQVGNSNYLPADGVEQSFEVTEPPPIVFQSRFEAGPDDG